MIITATLVFILITLDYLRTHENHVLNVHIVNVTPMKAILLYFAQNT